MFRVAVITNENEVAHSSFADTTAILKRPVTLQSQKTDSYVFVEFDKFSVTRLFQRGHQDHLLSFDALVIATNATNNSEVLLALRSGRSTIEEFIGSGKGVLILSQKKLSQSAENRESTGFLPERFDYSLCERPEASSAAGVITIAEATDRIVAYPNVVTQDVVEHRCEHNSFMKHRYRSVLVPTNANQFVAVLIDRLSGDMPNVSPMGFPPGRPILIRTASTRERVVATSMALDWAGHEELLENLLIYITEGEDQIAVLRRKDAVLDDPIDVYATRARASKLPVREYFDIDAADMALLDHRAIVVSPAYSPDEVQAIWDRLAGASRTNIDLYHLLPTSAAKQFQITRRSLSNSANHLALSGALWISRSFVPTFWGKSIWTYNYALPMLKDLGVDIAPFASHVLADIKGHIKSSPSGGASYDNVPNATAQLLELLCSCFASLTDANLPVKPTELVEKCERWIVELLIQRTPLSPRDRVYLFNSLDRANRQDQLSAEERRELHSIARETLQHYRARGVALVETVELAQWLELELSTTLTPTLISPSANHAFRDIVSELKRRQQIEGCWKNVSVTGDVLIALLRAGGPKDDVCRDSVVKDMLVKGVEYLVRSFDKASGNWSNDINATAKAARALSLFDRRRGLSSADFLADIHARAEMLTFAGFCEEGLRHDGALLDALLFSEQTLKAANENARSIQKQADKTALRELILRGIAFGSFVIALISLAALALVLSILSASYPEALTGIFGKWEEFLVSSFVGIVLTLVFMAVYTFVQSRLLNRKST